MGLRQPSAGRGGRPGAARFVLAAELAGVAAVVAVWAGFLFPDPYFASGPGVAHRALLWAARVGLPVLLLAGVAVDRGLRRGRIDPRSLLVAGGGLALGLVLLYAPVSYLHERSYQRSAGRAHPYLQLDPPRYRSRPPEAGPAPLRVFCLGGSTTEFVDTAGRGWPERVEARLRGAHPARPVEVHNLGRQWYTTLHSLITYETNLRQHRPDVLVVMHTINDVLHNADFSYFSRGPFQDDYGHFYGPVQRLANPETLPRRVEGLLGALWYHRPRTQVEQREFPGLAPYERNLRTLIALARVDGTAVLLMTEPNLYKPEMTADERAHLTMLNREAVGPDRQWSLATARAAMAAYNDVVRRVAREEGVGLVDLEALVPKTLEFFGDDVHYRDPAYDLVAAGVVDGLETVLARTATEAAAR